MVGDRSWTNTEIICTYDRRLVSGGRIHAEACLVAANKTSEVSPSERDAKVNAVSGNARQSSSRGPE